MRNRIELILRYIKRVDLLHICDTHTFICIHLALCMQQGNVERAISVAMRWTELLPGAEPGTGNLYHYHKELNDTGRVYDPDHLPSLNNHPHITGFAATNEFKDYYQLCQGKQLQSKVYLIQRCNSLLVVGYNNSKQMIQGPREATLIKCSMSF